LSCNLKIVGNVALGNEGHIRLTREAAMSTATLAPVLNATTRCDSCNARAYVVVILKASAKIPAGGELLLCAHDYRKHEMALIPYIAQLIDERNTLQEHVKDDGHV
jgi:hypothetical protein